MTLVVYELDEADAIRRVSGDWDAPEAPPPQQVLGASLWDFVISPGVRWLYRQILANVRQNRTSVSFAYRCDTPTERRWMNMSVDPIDEVGGVRFRSEVQNTEPRAEKRTFTTGRSMLLQCSICARIAASGTSNREWLEIEQLLRDHTVEIGPSPIRLAHAVCDSCSAEILGRLHPEESA